MTIIEALPEALPAIEIEDMPPLVVADPVPPKPIWPDGPPTARAVDVLEVALFELRKRGWCQGKMLAPDGRVCAVGAIEATRADGNAKQRARSVLRAAIRDQQGWDCEIERWNDQSGQAQWRVEAMFERAIARAAGR